MSKYIGDKAFYKKVMIVTVPMIIQQGITTFVNLLDNIMVGQMGTAQISGVSIANQLVFIFNLCIFGGLSGAGIFGAQFYGSKDYEGVRNAMRFKFYVVAIALTIALSVFTIFAEPLLSLYLTDDGSASIDEALRYAKEYLSVMLIGFIPFALSQMYCSTLKESGETVLPMVAGAAAVLVNLCLNWVLIFGHFGFPSMGATGAAVATTISRFVELAIVLLAVRRKKEKYPYLQGVFRTLKIPVSLVKSIIIKGMPLLANEFLWSVGIASLTQCYSLRGLSIITAVNISETVSRLFSIIFMSLGNAIGIIVGQHLGANEKEKAVDSDRKLIVFGIFTSVIMALLLCSVARFIPELYNTEADVKALAVKLLYIAACAMPLHSIAHASYFTLRSGGKTLFTFLFDSVYVWTVNYTIAYALVHFTAMPVEWVYFCVAMSDIIKCVLGLILVKKGVWINNIIDTPNSRKQEAPAAAK